MSKVSCVNFNAYVSLSVDRLARHLTLDLTELTHNPHNNKSKRSQQIYASSAHLPLDFGQTQAHAPNNKR